MLGVLRLQAAVYALIYLGLIPLFAAIYTLAMPGQFYHSTVENETELNDDARRLLGRLQEDIAGNFVAVRGNPVMLSDQWQLDIRNLKLSSLTFSNVPGESTATVRLTFEAASMFVDSSGHSVPGRLTSHTKITFPIRPTMVIGFPSDPASTTLRTATFSDIPTQDLVRAPVWLFFPSPQISGSLQNWDTPSPAGVLLSMSPGTSDELYSFWLATRGFPSGVSGNFSRMLYLSAVTITTVGFGDIVPLTTGARMAVAAEAVMGIVLAGLFLNAISRRGSTWVRVVTTNSRPQ